MIKQITRKEWIEALKSGEYAQAKEALHRNGAYCCLGVACALAGVDEHEMDKNYNSTDIGLTFGVYNLDIGKRWEEDKPPFDVLATQNDEGKTFDQIADLLIFDSWIRGMEQD